MKSYLVRIFILVVLIAGMSMTFTTAAHADPDTHDITSCADLQAADDNYMTVADTFNLDNDIDCSGVGFAPLNWGIPFQGIFNGNNHRIRNLTIDHESSTNVGLFYSLDGATITNLILDGGSVTGDDSVGALAGTAVDVNIDNVHSNLDVHADDHPAGGLIGELDSTNASSSVTHASSSGDVSGAAQLGGLIGYMTSADSLTNTLAYSWATGDVSTSSIGYSVGGLVGQASTAGGADETEVNIHDDYATGDVTAASSFGVGGLLGEAFVSSSGSGLSFVVVQNTYSTGAVSGDEAVGGLVGSVGNFDDPEDVVSVTTSFTTSPVMGNTGTGGMIGEENAADHDIDGGGNDWDTGLTGQSDCISGFTFVSCQGFDVGASYWENSNVAGPMGQWDFAGDPWYVTSGYPILTSDSDFDGISNAIEDAGPNGGDGNDDGIPDSQQAEVATFVNSDNEYQTILAGDGTVSNVTSAPLADTDTLGFPFGQVSFDIDLATPGESTQVIMLYWTGEPANSYAGFKFTNDTSDITPVLDGGTGDGQTGSDHYIGLVYNVTDGGENDLDNAQNGIVVDPVTLGIQLPVFGPPTTSAPTTTVVSAPTTTAPATKAAGVLAETGSPFVISGVAFALMLAAEGFVLTRRKRRGLIS